MFLNPAGFKESTCPLIGDPVEMQGANQSLFLTTIPPAGPWIVAEAAIKGDILSYSPLLPVLPSHLCFRFRCLDSTREKVSMRTSTAPSK